MINLGIEVNRDWAINNWGKHKIYAYSHTQKKDRLIKKLSTLKKKN